jgi:hypothetical protein
MQWFLESMEELGIDCEVGHPAKIRAAEPRKQKHDRRDAGLVVQLLVENRFPSIWMPSSEQLGISGNASEPACRTPCKRSPRCH